MTPRCLSTCCSIWLSVKFHVQGEQITVTSPLCDIYYTCPNKSALPVITQWEKCWRNHRCSQRPVLIISHNPPLSQIWYDLEAAAGYLHYICKTGYERYGDLQLQKRGERQINDHQRSSRIQMQKDDHVQKLRPAIYKDNKVPVHDDDTPHPPRPLLLTGNRRIVFFSSGLGGSSVISEVNDIDWA